jgi:hypothetical protein
MNMRLPMTVEDGDDGDGLSFELLIKRIGTTTLATAVNRITIITAIFNPGLHRKLIEVDFLKDDC